MKTHPHLLVRDALARCFVSACDGDSTARETIEGLARWCETAEAVALQTEDGSALFGSDGALAPRFAALDGYARDRARRYQAALGWLTEADAVANPLEAARAAWDAGLFFEVHEILEPAWLEAEGELRTVLQGLIMAGAALHHLAERNTAGARGLLREAARRLQSAPAALPYDLIRFGRGLDALAADVEAGKVEQASQIAALPTLQPLEGGSG